MRYQKGFTLVELMVVIVIIGVLASLAIPRFMGVTDKAKLSEFKPVLKQAITLYNAYYQEHETYKTPSGNIEDGNSDIGFDLPDGESRFIYRSDETDDGVTVIAEIKKKIGKYEKGATADLNEKLEKNKGGGTIPW
ncbi:MAG: type II secretion system protein [Chitinispirillaceae bacterium]|nr:type II secretion system protein [Chitinispirillaceae bacterium]